MHATQQRDFIAAFCSHFPEVGKMIANQGEDCADAWFQVCHDQTLEDCKAAMVKILGGQVPFPEPWSKFPAVIRTNAAKMAYTRLRATELRQSAPERNPGRSRFSMVSMLQTVRECVESGMQTDEALEVVNKKFPVADEDREWFHCLLCEDSGHVKIWHNKSIECALNKLPIRRYSAIAICTCEAGASRFTNSAGCFVKPDRLLSFNPKTMCRYGKDELLREWLSGRLNTQTALPF